jgi:hypothetical protein
VHPDHISNISTHTPFMEQSLSRRHRQGRTTIIGGLVIFLLFAIIHFVGPSQWDAFQMKDILKDVGWKWKESYDISLAKQELGVGMRNKNISLDIEEKDCIFVETQTYLRVECEWDAYIYIPVLDKEYVRYFFMEMYMDRDGDKPEITW